MADPELSGHPRNTQCQTQLLGCSPWWGPEPWEGRKGLGEKRPALASSTSSSPPALYPPGTSCWSLKGQDQHTGRTARGHKPLVASLCSVLPPPARLQAPSDRSGPHRSTQRMRPGSESVRLSRLLRWDPVHEDPLATAASLGVQCREGSAALSTHSPHHTQQQQQVQNTKINALPTPRFLHRCQPRHPPHPLHPPHPHRGLCCCPPSRPCSTPRRGRERGGAAPAERHRGKGGPGIGVPSPRTAGTGAFSIGVLSSRIWRDVSPQFWGHKPRNGGEVSPTPGFGVPSLSLGGYKPLGLWS